MVEITSGNRFERAAALSAPGSFALYVIDASLAIVLTGSTPADLAPPDAATQLSPALRSALVEVIGFHDFARQPIASTTASAYLDVRCMRSTGPAGVFFMVMTSGVPGALRAVA